MRTFENDADGLSVQDYLIIFTSIIYVLIVMPIVISILINPIKYQEITLTFLLKISETVSWSYCAIIAFFFLNTSIINFKKAPAVLLAVATEVIDESKKLL